MRCWVLFKENSDAQAPIKSGIVMSGDWDVTATRSVSQSFTLPDYRPNEAQWQRHNDGDADNPTIGLELANS